MLVLELMASDNSGVSFCELSLRPFHSLYTCDQQASTATHHATVLEKSFMPISFVALLALTPPVINTISL